MSSIPSSFFLHNHLGSELIHKNESGFPMLEDEEVNKQWIEYIAPLFFSYIFLVFIYFHSTKVAQVALLSSTATFSKLLRNATEHT